MTSKRIVMIGAGHAHLEAISRIKDWAKRGIRVEVVSPATHHYYSGMGPGMLGGTYAPEEIRFPVRKMVEDRGGVFHIDTAVRIDADHKKVRLASGKTLDYDVLSFNTGSSVPDRIVDESAGDVYPAKPIENFISAREHILREIERRVPRIAVVGGGPAALEIAGNLWRIPGSSGAMEAEITLYAGNPFLSSFPARASRLARRSLARRKIGINETGQVKAIRHRELELENGDRHPFDLLFLAIGVRPSRLFADSGLPTGPDGGLSVNRFLQLPSHPEIFGGGDCIHFMEKPLDKVGVHAVGQNPVLAHNLPAFLEGSPLEAFNPKKHYLLIFNLGDGTGIFHRNRIVFDGRLAFLIKDRIDRKFIKRYTLL